MKQLNNIPRNDRQVVLTGNDECKVFYNSEDEIVELAVGGTSLRVAVKNFFAIHEIMRKAAAKLVMQTQLNENNALPKSVPLVISHNRESKEMHMSFIVF